MSQDSQLQPTPKRSEPEPLLVSIDTMAQMPNRQVEHLRRLDSTGAIPGRVTVGRRVLFNLEVLRAWVRLGMPDKDEWERLQRLNRHGRTS